MSECTCPEVDGIEFWCERHRTYKTALLRRKCLERGEYWILWEKGRGPRRSKPMATLPSGPSPHVPPKYKGGPGTELKILLKRLFIRASGGCGCDGMAANMDRWGPAGCREPKHRAEILDQMAKEAKKRGLIFVRPAADAMVEFAIRKAERGSYPGIPL